MSPFLDSTILIKAFTENPDKDECRQVVHEKFITDALCLVESHYFIALISKSKVHATKSIKSLFKSNCIILDLDKELLFEAFKRGEKYNLDTFDLIHYTTALLNNCSEIISYDKDFDGLEIKRAEP
ncbi:type II toxin-antitoxin system VapC family toxin [Candidatus Woesearchaeota archaeon]|nr:type II toxin-antitoxin system VapC family toxin [Candidatus Woesearchaeota archaeon]